MVSRCLNGAEIHYTTTEKELLAIIYSVTKLRHYLMGTRFLIITDHKGLTFLNTTPYLNSRLIRWSLCMLQYDFEIEYCQGRDNIVADFFSRNPVGKFESSKSNHLSIDVINEKLEISGDINCSEIIMNDEVRESLGHLEELQKQDQNINKIIQSLKENERNKYFFIHEGILFHYEEQMRAWQVVIPQVLTNKIIDCIHSKLGHPGVYKTYEYIRQFYFWRSLSKEIKKNVVSCDLCNFIIGG